MYLINFENRGVWFLLAVSLVISISPFFYVRYVERTYVRHLIRFLKTYESICKQTIQLSKRWETTEKELNGVKKIIDELITFMDSYKKKMSALTSTADSVVNILSNVEGRVSHVETISLNREIFQATATRGKEGQVDKVATAFQSSFNQWNEVMDSFKSRVSKIEETILELKRAFQAAKLVK